MRGLLTAICLSAIGLLTVPTVATTTLAHGGELNFRPPDRARVRFSQDDTAGADAARSASEEIADEAGEEPPIRQAPTPKARRTRASDAETADYDEREDPRRTIRRTAGEIAIREPEPPGLSREERESAPRVARSAASSRVVHTQYSEPLTVRSPTTVTLGTPVFDPYTATPHASAYPAGAPIMPQTLPGPPPAGPGPIWGGQGVAGIPANDSPYWRHRTNIYGDFLYLRPRNAEVAYAVPIDGPVAPVLGNGIQIGPTAAVNPGWQIAFDIGFNVALSETSSIGAKYTRFDQTTSSSASIAPPDVLRSLVAHPLGTNAATDTLDAAASLQLKFDMIDADYSGLLRGEEGYVVNYFAGGRFLRFDQNFSSTFTTVGTTAVDTAIDFQGGGIRFGLEGERRNCRTGLLVFARGTSNFVVGEFDATYNQTDATGVPIVASSFTAARIVPMLDLEVGVGWTSREGRIRLTAGYLVSAWFNMVTTSDYIQAVQTNDFDGLSNTITFDGLMARATVQF